MNFKPFAVLAMSFASVTTASAGPTIERVISPGGIEAWLVQEASVPIISFEFAFRAGATQDPADKPGVANMLSGLLDEGAGALDSGAFQQRMENSAVELSFSASRDTFDGSLRTLAEKRDEAFELLRLAVNEARLDAEPIERIRAQTLARIRRSSTDPSSIAQETWSQLAFGNHPYARRPIGTEASVTAITRDDLVRYRERALARSNLVVAVVGAIDAATLGPALDRIFGALPAEARLESVKTVTPGNIGEVKAVTLPVPQTSIVFGRGGLLRDDPDYIPAVVMNHILGGGSFTSRLFTEVREKRGLAYSVYSYLDPMEYAGVFGGGLATRNDRAQEAIALIESEVRHYVAEGPTEEELAKAKKFLTGSYALNFDSSAKIARGLKSIRLQRMPIDYIEKRNDLVNAVTVADARRAAQRVLGDGKLLVVAVGQPDGLVPAQASSGSGNERSKAEPVPAAAPQR